MKKQPELRHPTLKRLLDVARDANGVTNVSDLAAALQESTQTVFNWEVRGVSKAGAMKAQKVYGCSVHWILEGKEPRLITNEAQLMAAPALAFQRLGEELLMADELTREQMRPLFDQLLKTPELAIDLGRRFEATLKLSKKAKT